MVFGEILIDGVFVAALLTGVACLVYVLYALIVERHVLRTGRVAVTGRDARTVERRVSSPVAASSGRRHIWRDRAGSPALPDSRG